MLTVNTRIERNFILQYKSRTQSKLLTKITAAQNEVALSYHKVRGLYFLAVIFAATIIWQDHRPPDYNYIYNQTLRVLVTLC